MGTLLITISGTVVGLTPVGTPGELHYTKDTYLKAGTPTLPGTVPASTPPTENFPHGSTTL